MSPPSRHYRHGEAALRNAARDGQAEAMRLLLGVGTNVNAVDAEGKTVRNMWKDGARHSFPDALTPRLQVLCVAACSGSQQGVRCLLEHGAQVRMRSNDGREPLDFATDEGVRQLLLAEVEKLRNGEPHAPRPRSPRSTPHPRRTPHGISPRVRAELCLARGPVGAGLLDELLAEEEEASGKKSGKKAKGKAKAKGSKGAKDDDGSAAASGGVAVEGAGAASQVRQPSASPPSLPNVTPSHSRSRRATNRKLSSQRQRRRRPRRRAPPTPRRRRTWWTRRKGRRTPGRMATQRKATASQEEMETARPPLCRSQYRRRSARRRASRRGMGGLMPTQRFSRPSHRCFANNNSPTVRSAHATRPRLPPAFLHTPQGAYCSL